LIPEENTSSIFRLHVNQCENVAVYKGVGKDGRLMEVRTHSLYRAAVGGKQEKSFYLPLPIYSSEFYLKSLFHNVAYF
jgi:hypothetical protein